MRFCKGGRIVVVYGEGDGWQRGWLVHEGLMVRGCLGAGGLNVEGMSGRELVKGKVASRAGNGV